MSAASKRRIRRACLSGLGEWSASCYLLIGCLHFGLCRNIDPDKLTIARSFSVNNTRLACVAVAHRHPPVHATSAGPSLFSPELPVPAGYRHLAVQPATILPDCVPLHMLLLDFIPNVVNLPSIHSICRLHKALLHCSLALRNSQSAFLRAFEDTLERFSAAGTQAPAEFAGDPRCPQWNAAFPEILVFTCHDDKHMTTQEGPGACRIICCFCCTDWGFISLESLQERRC